MKNKGGNKKYLSVLSDGKFHQTVQEGTPNSIKREYEDKDGGKHTKIELVFDEISGKITDVSFEDGDFGKNLRVELDKEGIMSLGTSSNFGEDLMKKLVGMNPSLVYRFVPYAFTAENGKMKKGMTVYQGETKIESFYWNPMTKQPTNGIPVPEGDTSTFDSDDWKMHFMKVRKFLIGEVSRVWEKAVDNTDIGIEYPEEELDGIDQF